MTPLLCRLSGFAGIVALLLFSSCSPEPLTVTTITAQAPPGAISGCYLVQTDSWTDTEDIVVMPLEEVKPPRRILAVGGLYPGDDGYSLIEWTVAVHPRTGQPDRAALKAGPPYLPVPGFFRIAAVGDIMPGRGFDTLLSGPDGIADALGDVASLLSGPDLLIGNLETAVTDDGTAVPKSYNFNVPRESLEAVTALGFDFYHLANNHGWDYGETGFRDTLDALASSGAGYSGAGLNLDEARFAWETETPAGDSIRILSLGAYYTERNGFDGASAATAGPEKPGVLWDSSENEMFIRETLGKNDAFTIVTVHGGYEWEDAPRDEVKALYRRYIDWGADLVLAHHPHVLQGMEYYNDAYIAYSLGNFIFPGMKGWYTGEETGVLEFLFLEGRIVGIDFHPVRIDDIRLRRAEGEGIDTRFLEMSIALSRP